MFTLWSHLSMRDFSLSAFKDIFFVYKYQSTAVYQILRIGVVINNGICNCYFINTNITAMITVLNSESALFGND